MTLESAGHSGLHDWAALLFAGPRTATLVTAPDGLQIEFSDSYPLLTGYDPGRLRAMSFRQLVAPDHQSRFAALLRDPAPFPAGTEMQLTTGAGGLLWIRLLTQRQPDGTRRFLLEDISAVKQTEQDLRQAKERFECAVQGSSDGIFDWCMLTNQAFYSDRWRELLGYSAAELHPTHQMWQSLLHPADVQLVLKVLRQHLAGQGPFDIEHRLRTKPGGYRWFRLRGQAIWDHEGEPVRMAGSLKDIHDRKLTELQLRQWHNRHEAAISASGHVIYEWDAVTDTLEWSGNLAAITGEGAGLPPSVEIWHGLLHPDDRGRVLAAYDRFVHSGGGFRQEYRVRRFDGTFVHVEDSARMFQDGSGHPTRIVGWLMDVSERKRLERSLLEANEMLEQRVLERTRELEAMHQTLTLALDGSHQGVWEWCSTGGLQLSAGLAGLLGLDENLRRVTVHPDDAPEVNRRFEEHRRGRTEVFESEHRLRNRAGGWSWVLVRGKAVTRGDTGLATRMVGTAGDISQRKLLDSQLREAMAAADAANRAKSRFLATMSHEIRTPMNGVVGMTELLAGTELSGEQHDYVQHILSSADNLLGVIDDVLDFSKIEAGKLEVERIPYDLARVAEDAVELMMPRAAAKGLELRYCPDLRIDRLALGDPSRTRQILLNLLSNAIKFTPAGSVELRLTLTGSSAEPRVRGEVLDTGIGLSAETAAGLFQPFSQADAATTRRFGGTGLGLAISRQLVELLGGRIGAARKPGGGGARFWFELPLPWTDRPGCLAAGTLAPDLSVALREGLPAADEQAIRGWLGHWGVPTAAAGGPAPTVAIGGPSLLTAPQGDCLTVVLSPWPGQRPAHAPAAAVYLSSPCRPAALLTQLRATRPSQASEPPDAAKPVPLPGAGLTGARILLVEDNLVNQRVALTMLRRQGATVDLAENGLVALSKAVSGSYDAILMDCHMPELDGFEATRRIRESEPAAARRVPIIAMTASAMADDRDRCFASGMDDFISKPVQSRRLLETIARWLPGE
ncbi:MAG: PAS domain-containing protein [Bryobacterales bacterium]|nr:PAS domain-containing protein [Bryobacterales bacterium]